MSTEAEARRQRPVMSMVVAMVAATAVAVGWYYLARPNPHAQPVQSVAWAAWVSSGRADHKLVLMAPPALPSGWKATSASYQTGVAPHWHLGLLTQANKYVGVEESLDPTEVLVHQYVDDNATQGKDLGLGGETWHVWTDAGGDYALIRTLSTPSGGQERLLVYGSAPDQQIRDFAGTLSATSSPTDSPSALLGGQ